MARATIELGKSIWVDPHLLQKMEKIHRYRRYEDGLSTHNPYNGDEDGLRWDHVIVLNFFEAYCAEISSGQVYVQQVFEYAAGTIVGVRNSILHRMVQRGVAKPTDYESLSAVADRIEKIAKESNRSVTWSIKNGDA